MTLQVTRNLQEEIRSRLNMNEDGEHGEKQKKDDVDRGWAWTSMIACFVYYIIVGLCGYSPGMLHIGLLDKYQQGNAETAVVGSVFSLIANFVGPFAGMFMNVTSARTGMIVGSLLMAFGSFVTYFANSLAVVIVTYGVISGIGFGFGIVSPLVMIGYCFEKYRGIATGLVLTGAGIGMFISGPVAEILLEQYGLNGTYLIFGGIGSQSLVLAMLCRPSSQELRCKRNRHLEYIKSQDKCARLRGIFDTSIFSNTTFVLILIDGVIWHAAYMAVGIHFPNYTVVKGSTRRQASYLMLLLGAGSTVSRIMSGLITGQGGLDPLLLFFGTQGIIGMLTFTFPLYSDSFRQQCVFAILYGIYAGAMTTVRVPICIEIVGISKFASSLGMLHFAFGIGSAIGPTVAGYLVDKTGDYDYCFYFVGVILIIGAFLVLISTIWRQEKKCIGSPTDPNKDSDVLSDDVSMDVVFEKNDKFKPSIDPSKTVKQNLLSEEQVPLKN